LIAGANQIRNRHGLRCQKVHHLRQYATERGISI
jgi:hypothetical protein